MCKVIVLGLLLCLSSACVQAGGASQELKDASQAMVIANGFSCKKVDDVIQTRATEWRVWCNGMYYQYKIVDNGGQYSVTSVN